MVHSLTAMSFRLFEQKWGFQHVTSSPCYPQSNGGIERAVQSAKVLMKKTREEGGDCYLSLLNHCNTPRDEVLGSPAQRLMSCRTKTILPVTEGQLQAQPLEARHSPKAFTAFSRATSKVLQPHSKANGTAEIWRCGQTTKQRWIQEERHYCS